MILYVLESPILVNYLIILFYVNVFIMYLNIGYKFIIHVIQKCPCHYDVPVIFQE